MNTRQSLLGIYWRSKRLIAPTLTYSQDTYEQVLRGYVNRDTIWLDLGCGHQLLPTWREQEEKSLVENCKLIVGLDYDQPSLKNHKHISLKVQGDITRMPFKSNYFNLVTANMVVEHLDNPLIQFREVHRVLRPGGLFIFHTPNALGYFALLRRLVPSAINKRMVYLLDGRETGDIFEVHYKANTSKRIEQLAAAAGFDVQERRMLVTDAVFSVIPPIMIFELLWLRVLMTKPFAALRSNIITVLRKQAGA